MKIGASFWLSICLEKPGGKVVNADDGSQEQYDKRRNDEADNQLEALITLFVGRRKLVLRKIWRWSVHDSIVTFEVL